jgi:hypothetical protein
MAGTLPIVVFLLLSVAGEPAPFRLELPTRDPAAPGGRAFAASLDGLSLKEREARVEEAILAGNVPERLRNFRPVVLESGGRRLRIEVAPDQLGVGSDDDWFRTPLSPAAAGRLCDRLSCLPPTRRISDHIHKRAYVRLEPRPIPPSPAMTTPRVFLDHQLMIERDLGPRERDGRLVAGQNKDVVITPTLDDRTERVAIYGWHRPDGRPIQALYTKHRSTWVDYSHGLRLVARRAILDGAVVDLAEVATSPDLAALVSDEGPFPRERFFPPEREAETGTVVEEHGLERGVRAWVDRQRDLGAGPILLVFYALPNGNSLEETYGRRPRGPEDWRSGIQQIGAQTSFIREHAEDRRVVVVLLENELKSWPAWRKQHPDSAIVAMVDRFRERFGRSRTRIALCGHSGGGSWIFGYLQAAETIPGDVERIAFLDANYAYNTSHHRHRFVEWLNRSTVKRLFVFAYHDNIAILDGKPFLSAEGGTWGRSRAMLADLDAAFDFDERVEGDLRRVTERSGRIRFYLLENPERRILHTLQVERNGYIEAILGGSAAEGGGYRYFGPAAYDDRVQAELPNVVSYIESRP